jgi:hypothetical protein
MWRSVAHNEHARGCGVLAKTTRQRLKHHWLNKY